MRHLASIKTVDAITPIENADRIETALIGGWNVVVKKGDFAPGDKCVYFEIDSCIPTDKEMFKFLEERGTKTFLTMDEDGKINSVSGHVLRTIKLRGQISQGLALHLDTCNLPEDLEVGTDVTEELGIVKYDPYTHNSGQRKRVGSYPQQYAIRSDCERVQNLSEYFDEIKQFEWYPTVKVDGYSFSVWMSEDGQVHAATRNQEVEYNEEDPDVATAIAYGIVDSLEPGMLVQFEYAGPKSNGNRLDLATNMPFVFSVWKDRKCVPRSQWAPKLLDCAAPIIDGIQFPQTVEEAVAQADKLKGYIVSGKMDEGIVWHTVSGAGLECLDGRDCFKAINNTYLLKNE